MEDRQLPLPAEVACGWISQDALDRLEDHVLEIMRLEVRNVGTKIDALEKTTLAAQEAAKEAAQTAVRAQEYVNAAASKWQSTVTDLTIHGMPRMEIEKQLADMEVRVEAFGSQTAVRSGTLEGISRMVPWIIAGLAVVMTLIMVIRPITSSLPTPPPPGLTSTK
jgi:hypothetical protein